VVLIIIGAELFTTPTYDTKNAIKRAAVPLKAKGGRLFLSSFAAVFIFAIH
jgi:hypothetical protein